MSAPRASVLTGLRVLAWRARWPVRGVLVLLAALAVARTAAPPPAPTRAVVVAARPVEPGTSLTPADLRLARLPARLVPTGAADRVGPLVGRTTAVAVPRGLPVVDAVLAGRRFRVEPPPGTVVVPVLVSAPAAGALLRPGDRVDLVAPADGDWRAQCLDVSADALSAADPATGTTEAPGAVGAPGAEGAPGAPGASGTTGPVGVTDRSVLARAALVVEVAEPAGGGGLLGTPESEPVTLVAVSPAEGRVLAGTSGASALGAVLVG